MKDPKKAPHQETGSDRMSLLPNRRGTVDLLAPTTMFGYLLPLICYQDSHRAWRAKVRAFVDKEITPYAATWDEEKDYPKDLHVKAYQAGIYGCYWPKEYGGTPPEGGVCDLFHEFIMWDELMRCGVGGVIAACFLTISIALPPILAVGSKEMKEKVAPDVISGKKIIALVPLFILLIDV